MLHLRLVVPADLASRVISLLESDAAVTSIIVLPGAARSPAGDVVMADVAREGANATLRTLRSLGIDDRGSISLENVDVAISRVARQAERAAPGTGADAVVWEEVSSRTHEESILSWTFLAFLVIASFIAAIGVLLDNPILIVGSMVVGPEFGPLAGICVGIVRRNGRAVRRSLLALLVGFPVAIALTVAFTWAMAAAGLVSSSDLEGERPLTSFIFQPDALSWVVGFLAGVAGTLSLTSAKSGALIGVLISVTTVPAGANAAAALAFGDLSQATGSALQLLINLLAIVVAGVLTLSVQQLLWSRRSAPEPAP